MKRLMQANISKTIRYGMMAIGVANLILMMGFLFRWQWTLGLWPWHSTYNQLSNLSSTFLASIAAAIAAPVLWIGWTGKLGALVPGAINLLITFSGLTWFMLQSYLEGGSRNGALLVGAILVGVLALLSVPMVIWGRRAKTDDGLPLPRLVRWSFVVIVVVLGSVAVLLILKTPNLIPWTLPVEAIVVYGWIFLGPVAYFTYAILYPSWHNAQGQLIGFLAYDLVLIVPFIRHFADVRPEHRLSLIVYTAVVIYSGLLAIYYLFINKATRMMNGWQAQ